MLLDLLKWWYGPGWADAWKRIGRSVEKTQKAFSLPVLLRNLFAPWKQIISYPGRSLDDKFHAAIDNLVSRTIGFFVRLGTIVAALVMICLSAAGSLLVAVVWPALPLAVIFFAVKVILG